MITFDSCIPLYVLLSSDQAFLQNTHPSKVLQLSIILFMHSARPADLVVDIISNLLNFSDSPLLSIFLPMFLSRFSRFRECTIILCVYYSCVLITFNCKEKVITFTD